MESERGSIQRRDVLKAGILAAGAALVPSAAVAAVSPLEQLREDYRRRVERLAEELKPRFLSGEFRGWWSGDGDDLDYDATPRGRLEEFIIEHAVRSDVDAYLLLAVAPFECEIDGGIAIEEVRGAAGEAMALDVYRIGLREGWYRPDATKGENPSADFLLEVRS